MRPFVTVTALALALLPAAAFAQNPPAQQPPATPPAAQTPATPAQPTATEADDCVSGGHSARSDQA